MSRSKRQQRKDVNERLNQEIARLRRELVERERQIAEQAKRIADLERQLALRNQNSTITSKPPASDGLAGRQRVRGRRLQRQSRRTPGGQPGHPGHSRVLVPADRVDDVVDHVPERCRCGARRLHERDTVGEPRRHQVTDLPPMAAYITEHRGYGRQCPDGDTITVARLPDEVVGQFGPQLTALIASLTVVCRMPRLIVQRFLASGLQISISLGSTQHAWEEASSAVAVPYAELGAALPHEPVLNVDETGHRTNGDKRWLWTFVARTFVVYRIAASRGSDVVKTMLGETFAGILGSDRLPSYLKYVVGQRQFCWAHVTRNLLSALDLATTPSATRFCHEALALDRRLFRLWHRFRGDPAARGAADADTAGREGAADREEALCAGRAASRRGQRRRPQPGARVLRAQPAFLHLRARGGRRSHEQCRRAGAQNGGSMAENHAGHPERAG